MIQMGKDDADMGISAATCTVSDVDTAQAVLGRILRDRACPFASQIIQAPGGGRDDAQWFEVLARPAADGLTAPVVELADDTGVGLEFDEIMLTQACAWAAKQRQVQRISVNLTTTTVQSGRMAALVLRVLDRTGLDASKLILEVPERAPLHDLWRVRQELARLGQHGVRCALDDVGGGHANLRLISGMTATIAKIDASLLVDALQIDTNARVLRELVGMLKRLGIEVVVEGVECANGLELVRSLSVWMQGFAIDAPKTVQQ
jgi:EAL domain-containing protein (putative c-di-GMP-specific phosphodiesterase class I)